MITNAIIGIIVVVVGFFDGLLPSIGVPSWFTTNATAGTAADIGNALSAVKNVLPVDALLTVLHLPAQSDGAAIYQTVKREYQRQFDLTWLAPAPMNDTQALATTQAIAQRYDMRTLSKLSTVAPQLRLGAIPEFTTREDGLPGLPRAYGGFHFKEVRLFDIGLKYKALLTGNVDVVVAFGTDGQIAADDLVVLEDDRHFWPVYLVAPVVRDETLRAYPKIAPSLDALAPLLTDATMRHLNDQVDGSKLEPADVARAFLRSHNLA